ncbi:diacylglycerol kinase [Mesobaculum littorinae]|uniref:Diacylglycerol kinase n=1 Tax=Mesobaculum littorinae TaxID=2486419 RepID=A0A438AI18_9RHOB|nr:diacylglycerol kinase family protein [Mesobaculum littorinae]RVV98373.1 diacylglycerol kinase [Mesobaculum littorinae]
MPPETTSHSTPPSPGPGGDRPAARSDAQRIHIVLNPGSGKQGDPALDDKIHAFAEAHGDRVTIHELASDTGPDDAARKALKAGADIVVAAGGDGTIAGVASALHGAGSGDRGGDGSAADVRLGILPMGTFNYFARGLDIPLDIDAALALLLTGEARPVAVAEVNGKLFLNNASLGIYPAILARRENVYKRWGRSRLAAYWSVLLTLAGFKRARTVEVTIDGKRRRRRTPLIFVAHSAYQLEQFGLDGAEMIRRGNFAVFLAPDVGRWGLLKHAVMLLGRNMTRHRNFELIEGREIEVAGHGTRLVARDGERERMHAPIRFTRCDDALQVILPGGRAAGSTDDGAATSRPQDTPAKTGGPH